MPLVHTEPLWHVGVGIDTARYGHHITFLRDDGQLAAPPLGITESRTGHVQFRRQLHELHQRHPHAQFHVHVDAAGQYADNLLRSVRSWTELPITLSVGEPKRNRDYHRAVSPKRKADATESRAMARFGVKERPTATPDIPPPFLVLRRVASRLEAQVKKSTRAINQFHQLMAGVFPEVATLVSDFSVGWLLRLLKSYPTAPCIAAAPLSAIQKISYLKKKTAQEIHTAATNSVGTLNGPVVEALVRQHVEEIERSRHAEKSLKKLLVQAYNLLPASNHQYVESIVGIGQVTAAALVATMVSIDRFDSADKLVGYYGVFPEEHTSGVDKYGRPLAPGTMHMSPKGNDLVRGLLWNCAMVGVQRNPAVRALFQRLIKRGVRGGAAIGYCMTKLLRLVFAVWKSGKAFDPNHYPWEGAAASDPATVDAPDIAAQEKTAGRKGQSPESKAVTAASSKVRPLAERVKPVSPKNSSPFVDFAWLREQVTMRQILGHIGWLDRLREMSPGQLRGPCPMHGSQHSRSRKFSVNLNKNVFKCFHRDCSAEGNVIDLWAALQDLALRDAALHLANTFRIDLTKNCEQRRGTR
jgi:transposase